MQHAPVTAAPQARPNAAGSGSLPELGRTSSEALPATEGSAPDSATALATASPSGVWPSHATLVTPLNHRTL